jgi:hypothetical protein
VERKGPGTAVTAMGRISSEHVVTAWRKVLSMERAQKLTLADEIYLKQPNLLASCIVRPRLGVDEPTVEFLLNILFVCYCAMTESGYEWPVISEAEQERQMQRMVGAIRFSEELTEPIAADAARAQYITSHPEQPLLAFVLAQHGEWLRDLASRNAERESDKFVMMASFNLVNCIAHAHARRP